jgi:peroxisomal membrane protein 4
MNSGKERSADTFLAGVIGGWLVFGERNAINEQVCRSDFELLFYGVED